MGCSGTGATNNLVSLALQMPGSAFHYGPLPPVSSSGPLCSFPGSSSPLSALINQLINLSVETLLSGFLPSGMRDLTCIKSCDTEQGVMRMTPEASRDLGTDTLPAGATEQTSQRRWHLSQGMEDP